MEATLYEQVAEVDRVHWWFQGRRRLLASVLRRYLPAPAGPGQRRIFDAACASGELTDMLREFGTVSAIDPWPEAVAHCRERFGDAVAVQVGELPEDLPQPGQVDVVAAFDVLDTIRHDRGALREIHRVLPPGGALVLSAAAFEFLWGPRDQLMEHRRRYGRGELRQRLEETGFAVDLVSYFDTWLFPTTAARAVVRRFRGWKEPQADLRVPSGAVNKALLGLSAAEARLVGRWSPPAGVSILAVAHKP